MEKEEGWALSCSVELTWGCSQDKICVTMYQDYKKDTLLFGRVFLLPSLMPVWSSCGEKEEKGFSSEYHLLPEPKIGIAYPVLQLEGKQEPHYLVCRSH